MFSQASVSHSVQNRPRNYSVTAPLVMGRSVRILLECFLVQSYNTQSRMLTYDAKFLVFICKERMVLLSSHHYLELDFVSLVL